MRRTNSAGLDGIEQRVDQLSLLGRITHWWFTDREPVNREQIFTGTELRRWLAKQHDRVARALECRRRDVRKRFDKPHHADGRRGMNRTLRIFVVQRNVAACHRRIENAARFTHAGNRFAELEIHFRLFGVTEVEVIRDRHRTRAAAGHVSGRFADCRATAVARRQGHVTPIPIDA